MAIIDGVEVFISLSHIQRVLLEFENILPLFVSQPVPWALDCRTSSQYIYGVHQQPFEVSIRISEEEARTGGADGIHITLKVGEGEIVNHFYSIKFSDFQRDAEGRLWTSIRSAIHRTEAGYKNVPFVFGFTDSMYSAPLFFLYMRSMSLTTLGGNKDPTPGSEAESANFMGLLEGVIDVTIIKVTHHLLPRRLASVTSGHSSSLPNYSQLGTRDFTPV